jgi:hypothetical protein
MTKSPFKSKTFWFAILFGLVQIAGLVGFADYQPTEDVVQIIGVLTAMVMLALRFVTNKAIKF